MKIDNSLTVYPAPDVSGVFPTSIIPQSTSALTIYGSFFTPATIVSITSHTVNSVTFINQGELLLSVTTSNNEGDFDLTISNGTTVLVSKRVAVYLGVVYTPKEGDWSNLVLSPNVAEEGAIKTTGADTRQTATWLTIPANINFRIKASAKDSPFFNGNWDDFPAGGNIVLLKKSDNSILWELHFRKYTSSNGRIRLDNFLGGSYEFVGLPTNKTIIIERRNGIWKFYVDDVLQNTYSQTINDEMLIKVKVYNNEIHNIKYIVLA
jgi:hypothetical protein